MSSFDGTTTCGEPPPADRGQIRRDPGSQPADYRQVLHCTGALGQHTH